MLHTSVGLEEHVLSFERCVSRVAGGALRDVFFKRENVRRGYRCLAQGMHAPRTLATNATPAHKDPRLRRPSAMTSPTTTQLSLAAAHSRPCRSSGLLLEPRYCDPVLVVIADFFFFLHFLLLLASDSELTHFARPLLCSVPTRIFVSFRVSAL